MTRAMVVAETERVPNRVIHAFRLAGAEELPFITFSAGCHLEREIDTIDPVAILTLGDGGLLKATGERNSQKLAGIWMQVTHYRGDPLLVLPNLAPEFVNENPQKASFFDEVVDDFVKVWQYGLGHTSEETWRYAKP